MHMYIYICGWMYIWVYSNNWQILLLLVKQTNMLFPTKENVRGLPKKKIVTWKQHFRRSVYQRNYQSICSHVCEDGKTEKQQIKNRYIEKAIINLKNTYPSKTTTTTINKHTNQHENEQQTNQHQQQTNQHEQKQTKLPKLPTKLTTKLTTNQQSPYNTYNTYNRNSVYMPITKNIHSQNQLLNTFYHIKLMADRNQEERLEMFYEEVQDFMAYCKKINAEKQKQKQNEKNGCMQEENYVRKGWKECLRKFIPSLDILAAIELYVCLMRYGYNHQFINFITSHDGESGPYKQGKAMREFFIEKILQSCCRYVIPVTSNKYSQYNRTLRISIQSRQSINWCTISKTMKMLFCSVCLIYDCGKHQLGVECEKRGYHYRSKNSKSKMNKSKASQRLQDALALCWFEKKIRQQQQIDLIQLNSNCSQHCYKLLTSKTYKLIASNKSKYLTPINISLINIGIQMLSYNPCQIHKLFQINNNNNQFTCAMVFAYLLEQRNLLATLQNKLCQSQIFCLLKETSQYTYYQIIDGETEMGASSLHFIAAATGDDDTNKEEKEGNILYKKTDKYQHTPVCFHNFLSPYSTRGLECQQQLIDPQCRNCECANRGFCLPECQCTDDCPIMVKGCNCGKNRDDCRSQKCFCYRNRTQCIPGICSNCFTCLENDNQERKKKNMCTNDGIMRGKRKLIRIGPSKIKGAGLGAFAGEKIKANELIATYSGQILQPQMQTIREIIKNGQQFYNFASSQGSIDARYMGNKSRFINHASEKQGKTNVVSLNVYSMAEQFIALYAQRDIEVGQQLFFDYEADGLEAGSYVDDHPFLHKDQKDSERQ